MGKIRTVIIKKISKELIEKYPNIFVSDFDRNKELLNKYTEIDSKHLRNRIAGYIVSLLKLKERNESF